MVTKKKATKRQAKRAKAPVGGSVGVGALASSLQLVPFPDALKAFDAALEKVRDIRAILTGLNEEVTACRAQRLAHAANILQTAAWTLQGAAFWEAEK